MNEILTTEEVAELLRLSPRSVYRLAESGCLPYYKPWGKIYFKKSEVEEIFNQSRFPEVVS